MRSIVILLWSSSQLVNSLGLGEPPDGKAYLGAWTDGSAPYYDTPSAFNSRIGQNTFAFQLAQTIPITPYNYTSGSGGAINITEITKTNTPASIYLTVYPQSLERVTDQDLTILATQISSYFISMPERKVFLRFAPEMQGQWMKYGAQPSLFILTWKKMYSIVKNLAPQTIIVWAPNGAMGYPFGIKLKDVISKADQDLLDTNKNGELDSNDDAYGAYYPGDGYVDWNGISWYWKGNEYPYKVNQILPTGYSAGAMTGKSPPGSIGSSNSVEPQNFTNFYDTYCQNKPCMFTEMGAAYHNNDNGTTTINQLSLQQAWWRDCLTSISFMNNFPKIKMFMVFEHQKFEDQNDLRDYRITVDGNVRNSWLDDFKAVQDRFIWADNITLQSDGSSPAKKKASKGTSNRLERPLLFLIPLPTIVVNEIKNQPTNHTKNMTTFYAGLSNNASSNLCFLNSVIQALASTQEYTKYLQEIHSERPKGEGSKPSIIEELLPIIEELNTPRNRNIVLRPTKLIEALLANHASSSKLFNSNQQDAHELLMIILEAIDLEFE
ncbi:hypothetical protein PSTG_08299 [Puccinia striiformis f. sp. tritici PST-78]|uniref:GH26 domain-containing protein n=1 Tax=Puccinia striiformis f. sp. tritici PST-78 TaxID=1165861 RepID=A0A0L0VHA4_9BASI|nr:hypothetical protein PSTG_08299 [Puccinia striiformis f. sp. tritici PST-78]